jgi:hypothetical protein
MTAQTLTEAARKELNKLTLAVVRCCDQKECDRMEARIKELEAGR